MALPSKQNIWTIIEQGLDFVCGSYLHMQASNSTLLNYLHRSVITMYGSPRYLCLEKTRAKCSQMAVVGDLDKRLPPSGLPSLFVMCMAHSME